MQLISIETKPMIIETSVEDAKLDVKYNYPKLNIDRKRNGLSMHFEPAKMIIDNTDFFESIGHSSVTSFNSSMVQRSRQAVLQAIERYATEGNMMLDYGSRAIPYIADQRIQDLFTVESELSFIPARVKIDWEIPKLEIEYTPDELQISWEIGKPEYRYTPYKVMTDVKQWNTIEITYLGEPNYFPPSSAPGMDKGSVYKQLV